MARGLRIHVPEGWYHVMSRGNGGEALYRTDQDRRRFLGLVAELPRRFGTEVHAFVLMGNQAGCGGRGRKTQTAALVEYTEAPIRQGRLENPWKGLVGGAVLGEAEEARALLRAAARSPGAQAGEIREKNVATRLEWGRIVAEAERILGRRWEAMAEQYGDWGQDGTMAVATHDLGWRLVEVVRAVGGIDYAAAAQGVRRFWRRAEGRQEMGEFAKRLRSALAA